MQKQFETSANRTQAIHAISGMNRTLLALGFDRISVGFTDIVDNPELLKSIVTIHADNTWSINIAYQVLTGILRG